VDDGFISFRQVFWLSCWFAPSHDFKYHSGLLIAKQSSMKNMAGFTAAGTAPVFHRIPLFLKRHAKIQFLDGMRTK
jgi:hypothetical protein